MVCMSGSTPHDLFDDFVERLHEQYKENRAQIKKWAKANGVVVMSSSTYEQFHDQLKHEAGWSEVPEKNRRSVFDSLLVKAKEQDENAEKNAKKNRKRFVELLQRTREVTASTTYEMAVKLMGASAAWDAVDEQTRRQCFDIFVDQLKIQSQSRRPAPEPEEDDGASEDDQRRKKKDKREKEIGGKKRKHEEPPEEPPRRKQKVDKRRVEEEYDESEEMDKKAKKHKKRS